MTNRESSKTTFHELADKLELLNAGATPEELVDDAFVDALLEWLGAVEPASAEAMHYAVTKLQATLKEDDLVASIRRDKDRTTEEKTFGQVMNEVRTKAGWNVATVAQRLGADTGLIDRLERDLVPLVQLTVNQWADLLELFQVRLGEFARLAARTSILQQLQKRISGLYARSITDAKSAQHGRELAHAIARALPDVDKSQNEPPAVDRKLIDGLTAELRRRQRTDLLNE